jgi:xanthosine utilization system XapX-like protein
MTADSPAAAAGSAGPIECAPRRGLAGFFAALALVSAILAFKVLFDLIRIEQTGPAILGFVGLLGFGVGFVFAARACRGLRVNDAGVTQLEVVVGEKSHAWSSVTALVYCLPRSPDAVEAFWFEVEGGGTCSVPLKCSHEAARFALARATKLRIMRYYQLEGNDYLEGEEFEKAERMLRAHLAGNADAKPARDAGNPQLAAG